MEGAADVLMGGRFHHRSRAAVVAGTGWLCAISTLRRTSGAVGDPPTSIARCSIGWQNAVTTSSPASKSIHIFKLEDAKMSPEHAGQPGTPPMSACCRMAINIMTEQRL